MAEIKQITTKHLRGPVLKLVFSLADISAGFGPDLDEQVTEVFNINDLAEVRFQFENQRYNVTCSISYKKHASAGDYTIKMNTKCEEPQFSKQFTCSEDFTGWIKIGEVEKERSSYNITNPDYNKSPQYITWGLMALEVTLRVCKVKTVSFAQLYEDDEFCDFHLMTVDTTASVPVHKACLIVHSDMFKAMLKGEWKETIHGSLKLKEVTLQTLNHLKEYLYLGVLPDDNLQLQLLLLLAKCYMINSLKTECVMKLAESITPEDLYLLQEFAVDNQIPELLRAILQVTPDETVQRAYEMENVKEAGPSEAKETKRDDETA